MNPEIPSNPREELEVRITALLLGELPAEEAAALRETIARDPELTRLHDRLKLALELVREAGPAPDLAEQAKPEPLTLAPQRRTKLLKLFKQPAARIIKPPFPWRAHRRELLQLAAMGVALLALTGFLYRMFNRPQAKRLTDLPGRIRPAATTAKYALGLSPTDTTAQPKGSVLVGGTFGAVNGVTDERAAQPSAGSKSEAGVTSMTIVGYADVKVPPGFQMIPNMPEDEVGGLKSQDAERGEAAKRSPTTIALPEVADAYGAVADSRGQAAATSSGGIGGPMELQRESRWNVPPLPAQLAAGQPAGGAGGGFVGGGSGAPGKSAQSGALAAERNEPLIANNTRGLGTSYRLAAGPEPGVAAGAKVEAFDASLFSRDAGGVWYANAPQGRPPESKERSAETSPSSKPSSGKEELLALRELDEREIVQKNAAPVLGDLPMLGQLFRRDGKDGAVSVAGKPAAAASPSPAQPSAGDALQVATVPTEAPPVMGREIARANGVNRSEMSRRGAAPAGPAAQPDAPAGSLKLNLVSPAGRRVIRTNGFAGDVTLNFANAAAPTVNPPVLSESAGIAPVPAPALNPTGHATFVAGTLSVPTGPQPVTERKPDTDGDGVAAVKARSRLSEIPAKNLSDLQRTLSFAEGQPGMPTAGQRPDELARFGAITAPTSDDHLAQGVRTQAEQSGRVRTPSAAAPPAPKPESQAQSFKIELPSAGEADKEAKPVASAGAAASNRFLGRFAYLALPESKSLELDRLHDQAKQAESTRERAGVAGTNGRVAGQKTFGGDVQKLDEAEKKLAEKLMKAPEPAAAAPDPRSSRRKEALTAGEGKESEMQRGRRVMPGAATDKVDVWRKANEEFIQAEKLKARKSPAAESIEGELARLADRKASVDREIQFSRSKLDSASKQSGASPKELDNRRKEVTAWEGRIKAAESELARIDSETGTAIKKLQKSYEEQPQPIIQTGETLKLYVLEDDSLNGTYQVGNGGYVMLPRVGRVQVAGKDLVDVEKAVKQAVEAGHLKQGTVMVERAQVGDAKRGKEADKAKAPPTPTAPAPIPQPEVSAAQNPFSTFSLNVSDVSFKLAAASLEKGVMPDLSTLRSEEFINAFDYHDPEPTGPAPVAFAWERARYPFAHDRDLLRFSVKTAASGRQSGRPLNLVLLLDNSGSMERADRVAIRGQCLRVLAAQLQAPDRVSVVAFARTARLWVDGLPGSRAAELPQRVGGLAPEGGTNLEDALNLAYRTALRHFLPNGVNRVVLLTDGAANLGDVDPSSLKQKVEAHRQQGIALDCFGIGWDGYNDDLLEVLSRNGDGRYGFVNTPEAAATEFAGQLAGALKVAASDVKVQVEWNPRRVTVWRQIGYAKHQLKKEQFRDNTVDAAEIAAAEAGNAIYTVRVNPAGEGPLGTVRVRFRVPGTPDYREHEWPVPYEGASKPLAAASPALRLAAAGAAFSEWLASSPFAGEVTPDGLLGYLAGVPELYPADPRPKQLEWMIRQARSLAVR